MRCLHQRNLQIKTPSMALAGLSIRQLNKGNDAIAYHFIDFGLFSYCRNILVLILLYYLNKAVNDQFFEQNKVTTNIISKH